MKKEITITFVRDELVFDIRSRAFAMARSLSLKGDTPAKDDSWLMDVAQDEWPKSGDYETAIRSIQRAYSHAAHICVRYGLNMRGESFVVDDTFADAGTYKLRLDIPSETKEIVVEHLRDLIHDFIVYKVLEIWCGLVSREHLEYLSAECNQLEEDIKSTINGIIDDCKERPMFPF